MSSLYDLTQEMLFIEQQLMESGGEITDALDEYMSNIDVRMSVKVENYCQLIRNHEAMAKSISDEEKRMQDRRRSYERSAELLKSRLRETMLKLKRKKVETDRFTVNTQKAGGKQAIEVEDVQKLPPRFHKITVVPDKERIREALELGEVLPGVEFKEKQTIVRIR